MRPATRLAAATTAAALALAAAAAPAPAAAAAPPLPVPPGVAEHTVTAFTIDRGGVVERNERVETWVSANRAKVVYTDPATGATLGACAGTRRILRCFDRDPALEVALVAPGELFVPSWAEAGRTIRRWLARGWLTQTALVDHRGIAGRRLTASARATGSPGETEIVAERETLSLLFRETHDGTLTSTEDVLVRERIPASTVDFRLNAPQGERIRSLSLRRRAAKGAR
ncbi:MAG TPA: hypothetical protein VGW10_18380 [Solirubrobacteraceae bacterium]|nr:hypothetical protein [Solirubrobacteraceae bacterium]